MAENWIVGMSAHKEEARFSDCPSTSTERLPTLNDFLLSSMVSLECLLSGKSFMKPKLPLQKDLPDNNLAITVLRAQDSLHESERYSSR